MKELEKLSDEALDHRLHYVRGLCPEGIAVIVPRYTADLNECAKVEAGLTPDQLDDYDKRWLPRVHFASDRDAYWQPRTVESYLWHATARQRTIALIATLEAK